MGDKIKVFSLFSGIGAFEKALSNLGVDYELVGYSEIDKYASKSYCAIHGVDESLNFGDITKIDLENLPKADLITHGSPCTSFSLAGKGAGGDKGSDTPSSLMWYSVEIINKVKPKYVIWENVKNVLSKKHRHNFDLYIDTLDKMGYKSCFEVLNAKHYGVPQNRERIFVISVLGEHKPFIFPEEIPLTLKLKDILEENVEDKYYLKDTKDFFIKNSFKMKYKGNGFRFAPHVKEKFEFSTKNFEIQANRLGGIFDTEKSKHQAGSVWDTEGLSPTLDTMQGGWRQPCIIDATKILKIPQATKSGYIEYKDNSLLNIDILNQLRIRKLTPKECWRLMSFTDSDIEKCISIGISNTQLYKQAGNSIVVSILEGIFKELLLK